MERAVSRGGRVKIGFFFLSSPKRAQTHANTFIKLKFKIPVKLRCKYFGGEGWKRKGTGRTRITGSLDTFTDKPC